MLFDKLNNDIKNYLPSLINSSLGYLIGYIVVVVLFWGKLQFSSLLYSRSVFNIAFILAFSVFFEELIFRKVLYELSRRLNLGTVSFVVFSSLIFALCHLPQNLGLGFGLLFGLEIAYFLAGVYFAILFLKHKTIVLPCFVHLLNNIFSTSLFSMDLMKNNGFAVIASVAIELGISYYFYTKKFVKVE